MHGLDPGFGGPHRVPAGLPRRTAIPPVPRRQRLEPKSVRPSPAPARSGPPAATSALHRTCEGRLGRPIPSVRQRALLGARSPLATHSPMRPRTPRRTRQSKRISLRSLSFVAGENARVQHIDKSAGTFTHPPSTRVCDLPLLVVVCSCGLFLWSVLVVCSCGLFLWSVPPWGRNARKGNGFREVIKNLCLPYRGQRPFISNNRKNAFTINAGAGIHPGQGRGGSLRGR